MESFQGHTNALLTNFAGLGLPKTLCLPLSLETPISTLYREISRRLPSNDIPIIITTNSNQVLRHNSKHAISCLIPSYHRGILPLRLSVPLCGGKGGFGSQLRAAGGRMSSKKKRNQGDDNGSNRNLDGRRLRTITEAKALAEYLATKPEMERKEKEARQRRWQQVVDLAEKREEELRNGSNQRIDGRWVEEKSEAVDTIRDAVSKAMQSEPHHYVAKNHLIEERGDGDELQAPQKEHPKTGSRRTQAFFGFEDQDDSLSESGEDSAVEADNVQELCP